MAAPFFGVHSACRVLSAGLGNVKSGLNAQLLEPLEPVKAN